LGKPQQIGQLMTMWPSVAPTELNQLGASTGVSPEQDRRIVAAFDFDVTITTKDAFIPFLTRAFGKERVRMAFLRLAPEGAKVVIGLSDRDRFKERLVRVLFIDESVARLREAGREHSAEILNWVRPAARQRIDWHKGRGDRLVMVSASLDLYLEPVAAALGFDDLLCTSPSVNHMVFDGGLVGKNCRGPEKVCRLSNLLGNLSEYEVHAYGDSAGDREMLAVADHPYFRAFESKGSLT
jgi:HAD superfamily hydrolase (TIGR01490 family)